MDYYNIEPKKKSSALKYIKKIDYMLLFTALILSIFGLVLIFSATYSMGYMKYIVIQIGGGFVGFIGLIIMSKFDYTSYSKYAPIIYILCILFIFSTFIFGKEIKGNKNWIRFMGIGIQPSEIVKIGFILTFAVHLDTVKDRINEFRTILLLLAHFVPFAVIILLQGDMGTVFVYTSIFIGMLFAAGLKLRYFAIGFGALAAAFPLAYNFLFKDYQKKRILYTFRPELDPKGYGYQVIQSKTAIGSGSAVGSGFLNGIQVQNSVLPEKQTDFIFSVCGEEFGFLGCILLLLLFTVLFIRILYIARNSKDDLGSYMCVGVFSMLAFQVVENIGMCLGLLPVIGITLPFISYGGSSSMAVWLAIGLVMAVSVKRKDMKFEDRISY